MRTTVNIHVKLFYIKLINEYYKKSLKCNNFYSSLEFEHMIILFILHQTYAHVHNHANNFYKSKSKLTSLCQYINHKSLKIGVKINHINTQNITAKISLIKNCLII